MLDDGGMEEWRDEGKEMRCGLWFCNNSLVTTAQPQGREVGSGELRGIHDLGFINVTRWCVCVCVCVCVYASVFACVPFYVHASVRVRPVCVYTCVGVKGHCKRLPRIDWRLTLSAD